MGDFHKAVVLRIEDEMMFDKKFRIFYVVIVYSGLGRNVAAS